MNFLKRLFVRDGRVSYAQCGEDLIVDFILSDTRVSSPSYLDIGAHDPVRLSNTYLFYRRGWPGVCVEPDPTLAPRIRRRRPRDVVVNVGVACERRGHADFFVMNPSTLSTFSATTAEYLQKECKHDLERVIQVPLMTVNELIAEHCKACPTFISLDIEGQELDILRSLDLSRGRPLVLCVETLSYSTDRSAQKKSTESIKLMEKRGYFVFADTYVNTIFVDSEAWNAR